MHSRLALTLLVSLTASWQCAKSLSICLAASLSHARLLCHGHECRQSHLSILHETHLKACE